MPGNWWTRLRAAIRKPFARRKDRIPRSLVILGKRWRVVRKPIFKKGLYGLCIPWKREIQLDIGLEGNELRVTFLHEVCHACLSPEHWAPRTEEFLVERLACRLLPALEGIGWGP